MARTWARVLLLAAAAGAPAAPRAAGPAKLDLGGVVLVVSDSTTAQVFHIVDQLSEWDAYAHRQYGRWARKTLALTDEDRDLLQKHAALRRARGWGNGFDQAFLVEGPVDAAAARAVDAGLLTAAEASSEAAILDHFAPRLAPLLAQGSGPIEAFGARLSGERTRLRPIVTQLAAFAESTTVPEVPVFLVANPEADSGGGEANGGRIVVEVPSPDPMGFLLHEALHTLVRPHLDAIRAAAASAGIGWEALNEGVAYAFAPGLTDDPARVDLLAEQLVAFLRRGTPSSDATAQAYMIAAVIRPLLRESMQKGETLTAFLPKAVQKWRSASGG
jgi:hypothetical protein